MGHLTRTPTSNEPEPRLPKDNPWGTTDDVFHLLNMSAVRCCCCQCVVGISHVTIIENHAFCPDHAESECQTDTFNHHYNVSEFIKCNPLT